MAYFYVVPTKKSRSRLLFVVQGPETDMSKVDKLCKLSQKGYASSMVVTNRNKRVRHFPFLFGTCFFFFVSRSDQAMRTGKGVGGGGEDHFTAASVLLLPPGRPATVQL